MSKPTRSATLALLVALAACEPPAPIRFVQHAPTLATLRLRTPSDAHATYDVVLDRWVVASSRAFAILDPAPPAITASPDALRHAIEIEQHASAEITLRESLSDGFAATLLLHAASVQRVTVVVREIGSRWIRCVGDLELCKSLKHG